MRTAISLCHDAEENRVERKFRTWVADPEKLRVKVRREKNNVYRVFVLSFISRGSRNLLVLGRHYVK